MRAGCLEQAGILCRTRLAFTLAGCVLVTYGGRPADEHCDARGAAVVDAAAAGGPLDARETGSAVPAETCVADAKRPALAREGLGRRSLLQGFQSLIPAKELSAEHRGASSNAGQASHMTSADSQHASGDPALESHMARVSLAAAATAQTVAGEAERLKPVSAEHPTSMHVDSSALTVVQAQVNRALVPALERIGFIQLAARCRRSAEAQDLAASGVTLVVPIILLILMAVFLACLLTSGSQQTSRAEGRPRTVHFGHPLRPPAANPAYTMSRQGGPVLPSAGKLAANAPEPVGGSPQLQRPVGGSPQLQRLEADHSATNLRPSLGPAAPPSVRGTAPAPSPGKLSARHQLCPGLVVPRSTECLLAVPTLQRHGEIFPDAKAFEVLDLTGNPVLRCNVRHPARLSNGDAAVTLFGLAKGDRAANGGAAMLLANCSVALDQVASPVVNSPIHSTRSHKSTMNVFNAKDEFFGQLARDSTRPIYILTSTRAGLKMVFSGDFTGHSVTVLGQHDEVLADAVPGSVGFDPSGSYYKLRVAAEVDVGMVLCGLLSIQLMEIS